MKIDLLEENFSIINLIPVRAMQMLEWMCREAGVCLNADCNPSIALAEWSEEEGFVVTSRAGLKFKLEILARAYVPPVVKPIFDENFAECDGI